MTIKTQNLRRRMGARSLTEQPPTAGRNLDAKTVVTVVRRLGFVALKAYEVIQGNLTSSQKYELAETVADTLKPLIDQLLHFELEDLVDTEVDNELP